MSIEMTKNNRTTEIDKNITRNENGRTERQKEKKERKKK